jgi:hypothetical protein
LFCESHILLTEGYPASSWDGANLKFFGIGRLSQLVSSGSASNNSKTDWQLYIRKAAELMSTSFPSVPGNASLATPGVWEFNFFSSKDPSYTILNAPSYVYMYYPEGNFGNTGKKVPLDIVAYGIDGLGDEYTTHAEITAALQSSAVTSDPKAGFRVFHVTRGDKN